MAHTSDPRCTASSYNSVDVPRFQGTISNATQIGETLVSSATDFPAGNDALQLRDRLLTAATCAIQQLLGSDDLDTAVACALRLMGEAAEMHRVKVFLQRCDPQSHEECHELVFEWWAPELESQRSLGLSVFRNKDIMEYILPMREGRSLWVPIEQVSDNLRVPFQLAGMRSMGVVPLFVRNDYAGLVAFDDCFSSRVWSKAEMDALTLAASAIGGAIHRREQDRILAAEKERAAQERAAELVEINSQLRQHLLKLSQGGDLQENLEQILTSALKQLGASGSCIFTYDEAKQTLQITASAELGAPPGDSRTDLPSRCTEAFSASSLPLWRSYADDRTESLLDARIIEDEGMFRPGARQWHIDHNRPIVLGLPLAVGERLLGYMSVTFPPAMKKEDVTAEQRKIAQSLTSLAAMAMETARLTKRAQDAIRAEDRNRLAQELHDTLAGSFTGIFVQLQAASDLHSDLDSQRKACIARAEELARNGLRQVREFVHTLTINGDDRARAVETMRKLVASTTTGTKTKGDFVVEGEERVLKVTVAHALLRVTQEALGNAQRYATAKNIKANLTFERRSVRLTISDDGTGFDAESIIDSSFGISGMRTRVERLHGAFSIDSARDVGTTINVVIPEPYEENAS